MIDKLTAVDCTLCGCCIDACPTKAISFGKEYLDFSYPLIDQTLCINCSACEHVCPVLNLPLPENNSLPIREAYVGRNRSLEIRKNSSSGGIFWSLAEYVLSHGGYVCGAIFDTDFSVRHVVTNEIEVARKMMGSKYVQSNTIGVYLKCKQLLLSGKLVLFTGCPCQVGALNSFLESHFDNLITVDLICHGIPSNKLFQTYLNYLENRYKSKIKTLSLRDKNSGWHNSSVKILFQNNKVYSCPITSDAYMKGYFSTLTLKESCYSCQFKNFTSRSDITIGDFWGAEVECIDIDDNTGLSAIITNTPKGEQIINTLPLELQKKPLDIVRKYNKNIDRPSSRNPNRDVFFEYVLKKGLYNGIKYKLSDTPINCFFKKLRFALRKIWYLLSRKGTPLY